MDEHTTIYHQLRKGPPSFRAAADVTAVGRNTASTQSPALKKYIQGLEDITAPFELAGLLLGPAGGPSVESVPVSGLYEPKNPWADEYDLPAIMRKTGKSAHKLTQEDLRKQEEIDTRRNEEFNRENRPPINMDALQNMLGDMFKPLMKPETVPYHPGHFNPPIRTLEDLMNTNVWGKKTGPWKYPLGRAEPGAPDYGRQDVLDDMQNFGDVMRHNARRASETARRINSTARDAIMEEGYVGAHKDIIKKAFQSFVKTPTREGPK